MFVYHSLYIYRLYCSQLAFRAQLVVASAAFVFAVNGVIEFYRHARAGIFCCSVFFFPTPYLLIFYLLSSFYFYFFFCYFLFIAFRH